MSFDRDRTIDWLNNNKDNGAFDGFDEELIIFEHLDDDEIEWYFDNWVVNDLEQP